MEVTGTTQKRCWDDKSWPPAEEVRPGLWSVPVPMPGNPLRYVLCYVFETPDGPVVVDPGWPVEESWASFQESLAALGHRPADVRGVLVTHYHADHYGLAHRLRDASGCWIGMHAGDSDLGFRFAQPDSVRAEQDWQDEGGVPREIDLAVDEHYEVMRDSTQHLPDRLLGDGELLDIPGWNIQTLWTPGHTPGHLCFHLPDHGLLLTGDHLLPRISSNVFLSLLDEGDPLGDYLESLALTTKYDVEALPAHEWRFAGVPERAEELRRHHELRIEEIEDVLARSGPSHAWDVARRLSWARPWDGTSVVMQRFALGETLAHLHYLELRGRLTRELNDAGQAIFAL